LDLHAPLLSRSVRVNSLPKWMNATVHQSRKRLRQAERVWRSSKSDIDRSVYMMHRNQHHKIINNAKKDFSRSRFQDCSSNPKGLWNHLNQLMGRSKSSVLPSTDDDNFLAEKFLKEFESKIENARASLPSNDNSDFFHSFPQVEPHFFSSFSLVSEKKIKRIISSMKPTSCELDPIPTYVLLKCREALIPAITLIVNRCLIDGMSSELKSSIIKPLFKKGKLHPDEFSSYRPVSNLSFLSKVIEKTVESQVTRFLSSTNQLSPHQHAYKAFHSCETALLTLLNSVYCGLDSDMVCPLVLLDMTAAFDLVDHSLLLRKLEQSGFCGLALKWFEKYLEGRTQRVYCGKAFSHLAPITCGVPQGSVLGPLLFSIFISGISDVIDSNQFKHIVYADDLQIFCTTSLIDLPMKLRALEDSINKVTERVQLMKLKLNPNKFELIIFGSKKNVSNIHDAQISINGVVIQSKKDVRSLGVVLDDRLTFEKHLNLVRKTAFFYLRCISKCRRFLDKKSMFILLEALVNSRINYCVSLYYGLPSKQHKKLQSVLNYGIRLLDKLKKKESVSSSFSKYGWLNVSQRVVLRLASIAFSAIKSGSPPSLASLLSLLQDVSGRQLRSHTQLMLDVPRSCRTYGSRAFSLSAPKCLNSLPNELRQCKSISVFKEKLKHHFTVE
jgi:hypothetical protein